MGVAGSKMEKALQETSPEDRFYGLENYVNTCYANSVLQILYWCEPFRRALLAYREEVAGTMEPNLLTELAELFDAIASSKKRTGVMAPRKFVNKVRQENVLFSNTEHQDAHEFLNYLLNEVCDTVDKHARAHGPSGVVPSPPRQGPRANGGAGSGRGDGGGRPSADGAGPAEPEVSPAGAGPSSAREEALSWVRRIFQGKLVTETQCLRCESKSCKEEGFLDLSLQITQNCSLSACLRQFSDVELLNKNDKYFCDTCCTLQEAQKRMIIKQPPNVLLLHLKRFEYVEQMGRMKKLPYRVAFPMQLRLSNVVGTDPGADALFDLTGVVVHMGSGPYHGHYVALTKSQGQWIHFDDESVEPVPESTVLSTFGSANDVPTSSGDFSTCFVLMYVRTPSDWDT